MIVLAAGLAFSADQLDNRRGSHIDRAYGEMPLYFIANQGQLHEDVAFYVQGSDKTLYFTSSGVTFALVGGETNTGMEPIPGVEAEFLPRTKPVSSERWAVKLDFVDANPSVWPRGESGQEGVISYFKGEPENWYTGIPTYGKIVYPDLWPGIDLVYSGTVTSLKYEFVVKPGANPSQIRLAYRGATSVTPMETGELAVSTPLGGFEDATPYACQDIDGHRVEVPMAYAMREGTSGDVFQYGFSIGAYDPTKPLILDPMVLVYCGYIGGAAMTEDFGNGIAVDASGCAYVVGWTESTQASFPVAVGPDLMFNGGCDAYVAKVAADGSSLVYCGYIGGTQFDYGEGVAVDGSGNAYVVGNTASSQSSFPVTIGPNLSFNGGMDAYVAKVNAAGTGLLYCGYIGGTGSDQAYGIDLDPYANAYVAGYTNTTEASFPVTVGPDLTYNGGTCDAFVAKVNASGTGLTYCGYIGGVDLDIAVDIAVTTGVSPCVTGWTNSTQATFPVVHGPDLTYNGGMFDAFVASVSNDGTGLGFCGYIGGTGLDKGNGVARLNPLSSVCVVGETESTEASFPVVGGPDPTHNGSRDAFLARMNLSCNGLVHCGYIGGSGYDAGYGIALDGSNNAYVTGGTASTQASFPVLSGPDLTYNGNGDAFAAKVIAIGAVMDYCSYIGGTEYDDASDIAVDNTGAAYVVGGTGSSQASFPVIVGPDLTINGGQGDAFVAKIAYDCCVIRGDVDHSGVLPIDIADLVYLVDYMFNQGPLPVCFDEGDIDGSGAAPIDIADLVYLVDYMFNQGPAPPPCP